MSNSRMHYNGALYGGENEHVPKKSDLMQRVHLCLYSHSNTCKAQEGKLPEIIRCAILRTYSEPDSLDLQLPTSVFLG